MSSRNKPELLIKHFVINIRPLSDLKVVIRQDRIKKSPFMQVNIVTLDGYP